MQLHISIDLDSPLLLDKDYRHKISGLIYASLGCSKCTGFKEYIHEHGAPNGKRQFRLFIFGELIGPYEESGGMLAYYDNVSLEVRSVEPLTIRLLMEGIENRGGIEIGRKFIDFDHIRMITSDYTVESDVILINMKTPVTVYSTPRTNDKNGNKKPFAPDHPEFKRLIADNFKRKYWACYHVEPEDSVDIISYQNIKEVKEYYKTKGNTEKITAYSGEYVLTGNRKYLDFLYQTGLGVKNPQGFGMFDIVDQLDDGDTIYYNEDDYWID